MKLIVGLGNPGVKYEGTRHNLGFITLDHFLKNIESAKKAIWTSNAKLKSDIAVLDLGDEKLVLAKPQTYMNNSGMSVGLISKFYKIKPEDVWIVYDELDLPLGKLKIRFGGAAAGHHGVESIIEVLGTDKFWRFRLGIGASHDKERMIGRQNLRGAKEYVLGGFSTGDQGKLKDMIKNAASSIEYALKKGIDSAMNRYNTR